MRKLQNIVIEAESVLNTILPVIEYSPEWANGTGYLDNAVKVSIEVPSKFWDDKNRFGIIIPLGERDNLVVFERYSNGEDDIIVYNAATRSPWRSLIETAIGGRVVAEKGELVTELIVAITLQNK
jgi:hypothetical protein